MRLGHNHRFEHLPVCGAASVFLLPIGALILFDIRLAQRTYRTILSRLFRMVRRGSFTDLVMSLNHNKQVLTDYTLLSLSALFVCKICCKVAQLSLLGTCQVFRFSFSFRFRDFRYFHILMFITSGWLRSSFFIAACAHHSIWLHPWVHSVFFYFLARQQAY